MRTHEAEAVIQHATRTTRVRSGVGGCPFQTSTDAHGQTHVEMARLRLRLVHERNEGADPKNDLTVPLAWPQHARVCTGEGGRDDHASGKPDGEGVQGHRTWV